MSIEEIRNQKGLVLLEYQEASERVAKLRNEAKYYGQRFVAFGQQLERNATAILENEQIRDLTAESAFRVVENLRDALGS